jgi:hypothetical protein
VTACFSHFDPLLGGQDAENMFRIAESFGSFGTYAEEATSEGLGETLPQRFDVGLNYTANGLDGQGNPDSEQMSASRTNYFRETYAYGAQLHVPEISSFMNNEQLQSAASHIGGSEYVVPAIVYANLLIPGQELAIHTDVPEFRGLNRMNTPQWLLVCMHHSGLFEPWRVPILTCVSWFGSADGGAFTFYPEGSAGPRKAISATHNTAVLLDTDSVFHGVERVVPTIHDLPAITGETRLHHAGDDYWLLQEQDQTVAEYTWHDLRYSISWKGYCFADAKQHGLWLCGQDQLTVTDVLAQFESDLRGKGMANLSRLDATERAGALVEQYIRFPRGLKPES